MDKGLKKCSGFTFRVRASAFGDSEKTARVGVLGASGYTGAEVIILLWLISQI